MSLQIIVKNSSVSGREPTASQLANGELALNYHADGPFITCKDTNGVVRRITGVWIGAAAPGTPQPGELWLDTTTTPAVLKVYKDGTDTWVAGTTVGAATTTSSGIVELATNAETQTGSDTTRAVTPASLQSKLSDSTSTASSTTIASSSAVKSAYDLANNALPKAGGRVTGALEIGPTGSLVFEGATDDAFELTLTTEDPTADRTITLPNVSGTVITTGDTGTVTNAMLAGSIADTKLSTISTAGKVSNSATTATSANTASAIVARDASGNFTAGTITANLTGNVTGNLTGTASAIADNTVTSAKIVDGTIVNADINASAAIAGTKIAPDFGTQNTTTTGTSTAASFIPTSSTVPTNGVYLPAANSVGISTNGTGRLFIDSSGNIKITSSQYQALSHKTYGYGSTYGAVTIGASNDNYGNVALGVDVSSIAGSNFSGNNQVIFPTKGALIPNSAGNDFLGLFTRNSSNNLLIGPALGGGITNGPLTVTSTSLGINAANPLGRLDVTDSSKIYFNVSTSSPYIGFTNSTASAYADGRLDGASLQFLISGGEKARLDSSGKLLIGLSGSTSNTKLHVVGDSALYPPVRLGGNSGGTGYTILGDDYTVNESNLTLGIAYSSCAPVIGYACKPSTTAADAFISSQAQYTTKPAAIQIDSDGFKFLNTNTSAVRTLNSTVSLVERLRITTGGLVGIGATNVGAQLDIASSTTYGLRISHATLPLQSFVINGTQTFSIGANSGGGGSFYYGTGNVEAARIDGSGRLLLGVSSARLYTSLGYARFQVEGTGFADSSIGLTNNQATVDGSYLVFNKTRGTSVGSVTSVQTGDLLGSIWFQGADGTSQIRGAAIEAVVDATPGTSDMPGRLVFSTTTDGASSPTERMRIGNDGFTRLFVTNNDGFQSRSSGAAGTTLAVYVGLHSATSTTTGNISYVVWNNGNVVNTNNSYGSLSDLKLKENIVDATSQWSDIKALQVRKYNFKEGQTHTQIGLIAQEVELVSPGLVSESPDRDEDGNDLGTVTKSVNYSVLYMKAVKALQEAMLRIEDLEARLDAANL